MPWASIDGAAEDPERASGDGGIADDGRARLNRERAAVAELHIPRQGVECVGVQSPIGR